LAAGEAAAQAAISRYETTRPGILTT